MFIIFIKYTTKLSTVYILTLKYLNNILIMDITIISGYFTAYLTNKLYRYFIGSCDRKLTDEIEICHSEQRNFALMTTNIHWCYRKHKN